MADLQGTSPDPNGAPSATGAQSGAQPFTQAASAAPSAAPAQAQPQSDPTAAALRAGSNDYRHRTLRQLREAGFEIHKDARGNESVRLTIQRAAERAKALDEQVRSGSGLTEAERAQLSTLQQQLDAERKTAEDLRREMTTKDRRQKITGAISGLEANGALGTATRQFEEDYELISENGQEYCRYQGAVLISQQTGLPMTLREVAQHMLARHTYLAKPGAAPGVTPVGAPQHGDLQAQLSATTDAQQRADIVQKMLDQLGGRRR